MEGSLSGRPTEDRYCRYPAPKGRCHGNHFLAFYIYGVHICSLHHLANRTEPSICSGDATLCQITLTTCSIFYSIELCESIIERLAKRRFAYACVSYVYGYVRKSFALLTYE